MTIPADDDWDDEPTPSSSAEFLYSIPLVPVRNSGDFGMAAQFKPGPTPARRFGHTLLACGDGLLMLGGLDATTLQPLGDAWLLVPDIRDGAVTAKLLNQKGAQALAHSPRGFMGACIHHVGDREPHLYVIGGAGDLTASDSATHPCLMRAIVAGDNLLWADEPVTNSLVDDGDRLLAAAMVVSGAGELTVVGTTLSAKPFYCQIQIGSQQTLPYRASPVPMPKAAAWVTLDRPHLLKAVKARMPGARRNLATIVVWPMFDDPKYLGDPTRQGAHKLRSANVLNWSQLIYQEVT